MSRIDLHAHTTASDGSLSPSELVVLAGELGVTTLAITDHDTTNGVAEADEAGAALGIEIVPGLEINTDDAQGGHTDILGYFVDVDDQALQALLGRIREARHERARRMVQRLRELGAEIAFQDVLALAGDGAIGRPHVSRALVASGFVDSVGEAFRRFIGRDGPAYAERYKLTPADACRAVRAAGGVPAMAHPVPPADPKSDPKGLRTILGPLADAGLGGLECYYPGYAPKINRWLTALADHFGLIPTGGSDYHGPWRQEHRLGSVDVPADTVQRLREAAGGR